MDKYYKIDSLRINFCNGESELSTKDSNMFLDTENNEILNDPNIYLKCKNIQHIRLVLDCDEVKFDYKENN